VTDPRTHLLGVAGRLFAAHGYSGTGMRQIATEAGMSLSMVNYYFGTKRAALHELLERFFDETHAAVRNALEGEDTLEGQVRAYVRALVELARAQPDAMRIAFAEHPEEVPGLAAFKSSKMAEIRDLLQQHVAPRLPPARRESLPLHVVGPAMATAVYSHFLVRPHLANVDGLPQDDASFGRYAEQISELLLYGLAGP
jgi:AcrR family transcriptional regulator